MAPILRTPVSPVWTSLPHPTTDQRGARRAARQAAGIVRRTRMLHACGIEVSAYSPALDEALRAWWAARERRALLPCALLVPGAAGRHALFCAAPVPVAVAGSLRQMLAAVTGMADVRVVCRPLPPTTASVLAREARRLVLAAAEGAARRGGAHRYLVAGTHRPR